MRIPSLSADRPCPSEGCTCACRREAGLSHWGTCCQAAAEGPSGSAAPDPRGQRSAAIDGASDVQARLLLRAAAQLRTLSQCNALPFQDSRAVAAAWLEDYAASAATKRPVPRTAAELAEYFSAHPLEPLADAAPQQAAQPPALGACGRPLDAGFAAFLEPPAAISVTERAHALLARHREAITEVVGQARALTEEHAALLRTIKSPQLRALALRCDRASMRAPADTASLPSRCALACEVHPDCHCGDAESDRGR